MTVLTVILELAILCSRFIVLDFDDEDVFLRLAILCSRFDHDFTVILCVDNANNALQFYAVDSGGGNTWLGCGGGCLAILCSRFSATPITTSA